MKNEAERLRVRQEGHALLAAQDAPDVPELGTLADWLAEPDEPLPFTIESLWPEGENVLWTGPNKSGKTTGRDNLIRSLADGDPFLGKHAVRKPVTVAVLDFELSKSLMRSWLRRSGIRHPERVVPVALREERKLKFNPLLPATRKPWVERLRGVGVLVVDCLRPLCDSLGLDENHDLSRLLTGLDELCAEAGIGSWVAIHHTGWNGERGRGDSAVEGHAGVIWRTVREDTNRLDSPRYFSAYGREVDVPESMLQLDESTRTLTVAGGSRAHQRENRDAEAVVHALAEDRDRRIKEGEVDTDGPMSWSQNQLVDVAKSAGVTQAGARKGAERAVQNKLLADEREGRNHCYSLTAFGIAYASGQPLIEVSAKGGEAG